MVVESTSFPEHLEDLGGADMELYPYPEGVDKYAEKFRDQFCMAFCLR